MANLNDRSEKRKIGGAKTPLTLKDGIVINGEAHYFMPFSEKMKLKEIIVGSRYKGQRAELVAAVDDPSVDIYMARGSFEEFRVVRQNQESMWP